MDKEMINIDNLKCGGAVRDYCIAMTHVENYIEFRKVLCELTGIELNDALITLTNSLVVSTMINLIVNVSARNGEILEHGRKLKAEMDIQENIMKGYKEFVDNLKKK